MSPRIFLGRLCALLTLLSLCLPGFSVLAEGQAVATLFPPQTSAFPTLTTQLDVFDDQGSFVTGLTTTSLTLLEDGVKITPSALETIHPALALAVAVNSGPALAARDGFGLSRYDKAMAVLQNWAAARPAENPDSLALTWNGGVIASQISPAEWNTRLQGFDPALRTSVPGLTALAFALDAAQQAPAVDGGKKTVLLISPHLDNRDLPALPDLVNRAIQSQTRVFVWLIDSNAYLSSPGALALQDLADKTGGRSLTFTGTETLLDPEEWLASLRNLYRLTYTSSIRTAGQHTLTAQINAAGLVLTSNAQNFLLNIQPPSVALLSPPIQITRQNPQSPFDLESFSPKSQDIAALIEFPDGIKRQLVRASLFVDGQRVDEKTSAPFNQFTWDLSGYAVTGEHALQVEAEDDLGLSSKSASVPVQVTVVQPPGGMAGLILRNRAALTIATVVFSGLIVLGILFFGGRRTFALISERRRARARELDPVTQPVHTSEAGHPPVRGNAFPWLRRKAAPPTAYLAKLTFDGLPAPGDPIALSGHELTFGTDPTQATNILDHPSISSLHARLRYDVTDQVFLLLDQNSVAGTWVNYEPTPKEGRFLKHGDVIHFGELSYRFVLTKSPASQKPTVTPLSEG